MGESPKEIDLLKTANSSTLTVIQFREIEGSGLWCACMPTKLLQSCLTRNPMDHKLPGSSVHGVLLAEIPDPGIKPVSYISCIGWLVLYC